MLRQHNWLQYYDVVLLHWLYCYMFRRLITTIIRRCLQEEVLTNVSFTICIYNYIILYMYTPAGFLSIYLVYAWNLVLGVIVCPLYVGGVQKKEGGCWCSSGLAGIRSVTRKKARQTRLLYVLLSNTMHGLSSVYWGIKPLHMSGALAAHHQQVEYICIFIYIYICGKWNLLYCTADCQRPLRATNSQLN
jgi:hypothetical protein